MKELAAVGDRITRCWDGLPRRYTSHAIRVLRVRRRWRSMPMVPWRTVFFAVNFGTTVLFVIACVVGVGEWLVVVGSPFAFLGAVCFVGLALAFGITEWLLYVRKVRNLERPLGVVCGLVGGLAIFAFISNAAEAAVKGGSPGVWFWPYVWLWLGFGTVCVAVAAFGLWCCWLRVRRRTFPEERGFPVGGPAAP